MGRSEHCQFGEGSAPSCERARPLIGLSAAAFQHHGCEDMDLTAPGARKVGLSSKKRKKKICLIVQQKRKASVTFKGCSPSSPPHQTLGLLSNLKGLEHMVAKQIQPQHAVTLILKPWENTRTRMYISLHRYSFSL